MEFPMSGGSTLEIGDLPGTILLTMSLPGEDRPPIVCALDAHDVGFLIEALIGHGQGAFAPEADDE
jgi:hypothetical protein